MFNLTTLNIYLIGIFLFSFRYYYYFLVLSLHYIKSFRYQNGNMNY